MEIYFVRHGETEYNRKYLHQGFDVPLSEHGREQIKKTAEILKGIHATKLITSDLTRAYQSAEIIGEDIGLEPELSPLFREVKRPSELYDRRYVSMATLKAGIGILTHLHKRSWHYSDEENLYDLKERVARAVEHLKEVGRKHEKVIIVSHAFIINIFIKYMCMYKDVRVRDYLRTLVAAKRLGNASISTVTFSDDKNPYTCDWILLKINDRSHLET